MLFFIFMKGVVYVFDWLPKYVVCFSPFDAFSRSLFCNDVINVKPIILPLFSGLAVFPHFIVTTSFECHPAIPYSTNS